MNSPHSWRGRSLHRAALPLGVMLGMFSAFSISAYAAHCAGAHELAAMFLGLSIASLLALRIFA